MIIAIGVDKPNRIFATQKDCMEKMDISRTELFQALKYGYEFKGYCFDELLGSEYDYIKVKDGK